MILALALDAIVALGIVALAVVWLARRTWLTMVKRTSGGCACPNASVCGTKDPRTGAGGGPGMADLSAAAARAVDRLGGKSR